MPIYEYQTKDPAQSCPHCREVFDCIRKLSDPPLLHCPECGADIKKLISAPAVGASKSNFDDQAKSAGFKKYKKLGKGEYEKQY
jgi:putative FmdB family regulatory protein